MINISRDDQRRALEEGLGIGCLAIGIAAFTSNKKAVEAAFSSAWRNWIWVAEFPDVNVTPTRCEILHILGMTSTRLAPAAIEWKRGRECAPSLRNDAELKEIAASLEETCGFLLDGWIDIANAFVERLGANSVRRSA